jgi:hypothetical protein
MDNITIDMNTMDFINLSLDPHCISHEFVRVFFLMWPMVNAWHIDFNAKSNYIDAIHWTLLCHPISNRHICFLQAIV